MHWGVKPIRRVLQFAPSTYYAATTRPPSARQLPDEQLTPEITRVWTENRRVYGAEQGVDPLPPGWPPRGALRRGTDDA